METNTTSRLLDVIKEELGIETITPEMTFEELGMDSLDYICLINEIRDKVGPITRQQAQGCVKVSDLIRIFE